MTFIFCKRLNQAYDQVLFQKFRNSLQLNFISLTQFADASKKVFDSCLKLLTKLEMIFMEK